MATFAESAVSYTTGQLLQANTELANAQTVLKLALDSGQVVVGDADYFTLKNKVNFRLQATQPQTKLITRLSFR